MTSITGLGNTSPVLTTQSSTKKPQDQGKETGNRPPPPPQYDEYTMSQEAQSAFSLIEEELDESLFDHMDDVTEPIDYEALGITEEDMDFSEYDIFASIGEEETVEEADTEVDNTIENSLDIYLGEADVEVEEETEDTEVEEDTSTETVVDANKVHGYLSSLTDEDRAMLAIAYQANQILTWEGSTLFDYLGDDSSWFDMESGSTDSSSVDWDSLMEQFNALTGNLGSTEETEEDDAVEEDSDVLEEIEDESILNEDQGNL